MANPYFGTFRTLQFDRRTFDERTFDERTFDERTFDKRTFETGSFDEVRLKQQMKLFEQRLKQMQPSISQVTTPDSGNVLEIKQGNNKLQVAGGCGEPVSQRTNSFI